MDVRAVGITKEFGALAALNGVDLTVGAGELMALLGPSGSGKTTLLRVIAGLENAEAGQIYFGTEDATDIPVRHRGVGFVFQHYALFKHLTVFDNIAYGLRARRRNRPSATEIRSRVMTLLDLVQLGGLEKRFPNQLSGGQRQRVALARALAVEPRVLLLDEPFGALDARVRKDLRRWLREVHDQTGRTTIFVTHDQDEALELADRVTILNRGRIEQIGTPDEVHDAPASSFVMSFVGESTRLPVEIQGGEVCYRGRPLLRREAADGTGGLYLRPDDAAITPAGPETLAGTVALMRRGAGGRRAEIRLGEGDDIIEVAVPPEMPLARGEAVHVAIRGGRVFAG